jgi:hypothetical protein
MIAQPQQSVLSSMQRATIDRILVIAVSYRVTKSLMSSGKFWMVSPDPEQPATPQLVPTTNSASFLNTTAELASNISTRWALLIITDYQFLQPLGRYITFGTGKKLTVENPCESQRIPSLIYIQTRQTLKETAIMNRIPLYSTISPTRTFATPRGAVRVVSTPASYYSSSGFKSRPGDRLPLFSFYVGNSISKLQIQVAT